MRKLIVLLSLATIFAIYFGTVTTFAADRSDQSIERFCDRFGLDDDDLAYGVKDDPFDYASYFFMDEDEDHSVYGSFSFSSGLEHLKFSSFACDKKLVGCGEEGTTVGTLLYTESEGQREVLDYKVRTLGASGLFSDEIEFAYNEVQYLLVAVQVEEKVYSNVYEVTTKEMATKSLLENLEINFMMEEEASIVPEFDLSIMAEFDF